MKYFIKYWYRIVLGLGVALYAAIFSYFSLLRYDSFWTGLDLGNMDQTVWNTLHGSFFSLSNNGVLMTRLAVHADFLLVLFAPFYAMWASPKLLLIMQSIYLGLGMIPAFLIARHLLKRTELALGIALLYSFNTLIQWVNMFDFHMVSLVAPLFLLIWYFWLKKQWRGYWVCFAALLLTKEEIGLLMVMFGLLQLVTSKERVIGFTTAIIGLSYSFIMIFIFMPLVSVQDSHWFWSWYEVRNWFSDPSISAYIILLLKSFGFLPLLGAPWLVLAVPELFINLSSRHVEMQSIRFHYTTVFVPVFTIASIYGLLLLARLPKVSVRYAQSGVLILAVAVALRVTYHYGPLPTTESCWCYPYLVSENDRSFEKVLRSIPQTASVTSSPELHAHLTHRQEAYVLPYATDSADFIALIDQVRSIDVLGSKPEELALIQKLESERKYVRLWHGGHYYLYKKLP